MSLTRVPFTSRCIGISWPINGQAWCRGYSQFWLRDHRPCVDKVHGAAPKSLLVTSQKENVILLVTEGSGPLLLDSSGRASYDSKRRFGESPTIGSGLDFFRYGISLPFTVLIYVCSVSLTGA